MAGNVSNLTVDVPLPGDANDDDRVNLSDFNIVAGNFGAAGRGVEHGDFNFDGLVNLADFNLLAGRFGASLDASVAGGPGESSFGDTKIDDTSDLLEDALA
jgi:hypothetical protein